MGRLLDLSRRASGVSDGVPKCEISEISEKRVDPYSERMDAALRQISRPDYSAGMILWLDKAYPLLYVELTDGLPNEIQRQWETHAPIEEFDNTVDRWLAAHGRAADLYRGRRSE